MTWTAIKGLRPKRQFLAGWMLHRLWWSFVNVAFCMKIFNHFMACRYSCGNGANTLLDAARILDMGLSEMGSLSMHDWTPEDVMLFEQGLNENRRDFAGIAKKFLPHKGSLKVCSFYYNLWKSRVIPEARLWYQRRDEVILFTISYKSAVRTAILGVWKTIQGYIAGLVESNWSSSVMDPSYFLVYSCILFLLEIWGVRSKLRDQTLWGFILLSEIKNVLLAGQGSGLAYKFSQEY